MIEVEGLRMTYRTSSGRRVPAVKGISFRVPTGSFFTLLGPSGCGKSSTLRSIAGLEVPDAGRIRIGAAMVYSDQERLLVPPHRRSISMDFQSYAIWPHMSVFENVAFPLKVRNDSKSEIESRVRDSLRLVGLAGMGSRSATQLSGGQQQRVALARAIVRDADVLLLDEPLSNLDAKLRLQMREELQELQRRVGVTTIYVTHDQDEAISLSDQVVVMRDGMIVEGGEPAVLYARPRCWFTAHFMGGANFWNGTIRTRHGDVIVVATPLGELECVGAREDFLVPGLECSVMLRPEHAVIEPRDMSVPDREPSRTNTFAGRVRGVKVVGRSTDYAVTVGEHTIVCQSMGATVATEGDEVSVTLSPEHCVVLECAGPES
jgi:iron(III) transport system ATP-binding protein